MQLEPGSFVVVGIGHLKTALGHEIPPTGLFNVSSDDTRFGVVTKNANADGSPNADGTPNDPYHFRVYAIADGSFNINTQYVNPDGTRTAVKSTAVNVVEGDAVTDDLDLSGSEQAGTPDQAVPLGGDAPGTETQAAESGNTGSTNTGSTDSGDEHLHDE